MTRTVSLIQAGVGRVGGAVASLVAEQVPRWRARYGVDVYYAAIADSSAFVVNDTPVFHGDAPTLSAPLAAALARRTAGERFAALPNAIPFARWERILAEALAQVASPADLVVLDCATGADTAPLLLAARAAGASAVLANKDPLVGPHAQFTALTEGNGSGSLRISATVGAGLPILATLARMAASGDTLLDLSARASGSLGFLCDQLSQGVAFDAAVREAVAQGYTEPDPRQDLSGFDVARKLLILSRIAGYDGELSDVAVESLVPPGAETLSTADFLAALPDYAAFLADTVRQARAEGRVLRYVARLEENGSSAALLLDLAPGHPLAYGSGPDNVFVLRTARYSTNPLTIAGPGAGIAVTAGAVVADLVQVIGAL